MSASGAQWVLKCGVDIPITNIFNIPIIDIFYVAYLIAVTSPLFFLQPLIRPSNYQISIVIIVLFIYVLSCTFVWVDSKIKKKIRVPFIVVFFTLIFLIATIFATICTVEEHITEEGFKGEIVRMPLEGIKQIESRWLINTQTEKCHEFVGLPPFPEGYVEGNSICNGYITNTEGDPSLCEKYFENMWLDACREKQLKYR